MSIGKKQKIGNKYYLGMHIVPFEKVDAIVEIIAAKKSLWRGWWSGGRLNINQTNHMGGDEREGGISGGFDLMTGEVTQLANDYLQRLYGLAGTLASAFRGVVSVVARQPYIGANTGRLPELGWKGVNLSEVVDGWKADKSLGYIESSFSTASIYIAMDCSLSMSGTRLATQRTALAAFVRTLKGTKNSVKVVAWCTTVLGTIERFNCDDDDYEDIAVWLEAFNTTAFGTFFDTGVSLAAAFFAADESDITLSPPSLLGGAFDVFGRGGASSERRRVVIFTTDGEPEPGTDDDAADILDAIARVEVYCFQIVLSDTTATEKLDNTPVDGIPVLSGSDPLPMQNALSATSLQWADVNAVHHIRHLLITKKRGGQATAADIGDSFDDAADACYAEGMFLSVPYSKYSSNREAINDIKRHIDAQVFRSSITGKWEIKLIRGDYTFEDLPVLDSAIVTDWSGVDVQAASELPNQVTVTYTKRGVQEPGSVTKANVAAVRRKGRVIPSDPIDYPLATWRPLAARFAARDASGISVPVLSGTLPLLYLPAGLGLGDAVVLNEPEVLINNVICRIVEIVEPDGIDNSASIRVVEDRFTLGQEVLGSDDSSTAPRALAADPRVIMEAPYYTLVAQAGQSDTDAALIETEELGFLFTAAGAPTQAHYAATVASKTTGDYEEVYDLSYSPVATLETALTRAADDDTVTVDLNDTLATVALNDLASIGTEIVRIDAMMVSGPSVICTIGRGCLDTVPVAHDIGEKIVFWGRGEVAEDRYLDGEELDVIILTKVPGDTIEVSDAPVDTVTFDSRAVRPYPPGRFKVNGSYADNGYYDDVVLTWAHRDRLSQTTAVPEDHDDTDIGPEAGTTYTVRAEAIDATGASLGVFYTDTGISGTSHDYPDATATPGGTAWIDFSVTSVRDGFESWQNPTIRVLSVDARVTEDGGDFIETSDGDMRATED